MSTAVNATHTSVPTSSRAPSIPANHSHTESAYTNGHHHHHHHDVSSSQSGSSNAAKKGKGKKTTDPNEASNLIAAKISQLELDAAGDKEQEAEIGGFRNFQDVFCESLVWRMAATLRYILVKLYLLNGIPSCLSDPSHRLRRAPLSCRLLWLRIDIVYVFGSRILQTLHIVVYLINY
jgi:hypothetical protein